MLLYIYPKRTKLTFVACKIYVLAKEETIFFLFANFKVCNSHSLRKK
ncbi:hypothetical protein M144_4183 [Bacteroides fragilis str. 3-F-2 |nr:hypothetical protein M144_4183 [Bacteroides fragilis str. 3-F-2 \